MRLTRGEAFWLTRRRAGETMPERAARFAISEDRLRRWEWDREASPLIVRGLADRPLTPGEYSALARRRSGYGLREIAWKLGISRVTLIKREKDRTTSAMDLARWWKARGYPRALAAAPVSVREPDGIARRST